MWAFFLSRLSHCCPVIPKSPKIVIPALVAGTNPSACVEVTSRAVHAHVQHLTQRLQCFERNTLRSPEHLIKRTDGSPRQARG